ncbi:hypothetical protein ACB092_07G133000 [Castanea dentata]
MCMLPCVFCIGFKVITSMDVVCIVGLCGGDILGFMALLPQFLCLKNFVLGWQSLMGDLRENNTAFWVHPITRELGFLGMTVHGFVLRHLLRDR